METFDGVLQDGTTIEWVFETAVNRLKDSSKNKVIILMTDGLITQVY
jgi:hypothetical protein